MEPQAKASDLFTRNCYELIEEMESLNKATAEYDGKVGFSKGRFYATGYTKRQEKPQREPTAFELATAKASGAINRLKEKGYRQFWGASTTNTLQAIDTLRVEISKQIKEYNSLSSDDKMEVDSTYRSLMETLERTKNEGLKRLKERYENVSSGKGDQETIRREREFQTIYNQFTSEAIELLREEDLKTDKKQRANRQIVLNGSEYSHNLTALPHVEPNKLLVVTEKIISDAVYDATFRDQKKTTKSQLEENTFQIQPYLHVPPLVPQGGRNEAGWVSIRCLKGPEGFHTTTDEVYSTAERAEIDKKMKKAKKAGQHEVMEQLERDSHLPNIKVQNDAKLGHLTITCGLIDTPLKADEFVETVKNELAKREAGLPPLKVRVCLHQLNSRAAERKYVENQHRMSRYVEEQLKISLNDPEFCSAHALVSPGDSPVVTHENSAFNVASEISPWEDAENQTMNLEAYAIRLFWGLEEIRDGFNEQQKEYVDNLGKLALVMRETLGAKKQTLDSVSSSKDKKEAKEELNQSQKEMTKLIKELRVFLESIPSTKDMYRNSVLSLLIDITRQAVPNSQEYADRVRVTQVERNFILDMITGSISEMNCKSGLDRTGLARSLWDAMATMMKNKMDELEKGGVAPEKAKKQALIYLINLVNNQDELSKMHNSFIEDFLETRDINYKVKLESPTAPYKGDFRKEYLKFLQRNIGQIVQNYDLKMLGKVGNSADLLQALQDTLHYQDLVGYHLLSVGLPVTQASTGVAGLKYNHTKESKTWAVSGFINQHLVGNPHPLRRMPAFIQQEDGQVIRLIEGETALTDAGYDLFERLSSNRGG